jgi:hypothetical protein
VSLLLQTESVERSKFGSLITRSQVNAESAQAYYLTHLVHQDFLPAKGGDSQTAYFHNPYELEIIGYLGGMVSIYRCHSLEVFIAELEAIESTLTL